MNAQRLELLKKYVEEDPHDPFNWYALALEYAAVNTNQALEILDTLLRDHPLYVPSYYQAGKLMEAHGNPARAMEIFEKGIQVAQQQRDTKAAQELRRALDELRDE